MKKINVCTSKFALFIYTAQSTIFYFLAGLSPEPTLKLDKSIEKRVSFDSNITNRLIPEKSVSVLRTQSLTENRHGKERHPIFVNRSFGGEDHIDDTSVTQEVCDRNHFCFYLSLSFILLDKLNFHIRC